MRFIFCLNRKGDSETWRVRWRGRYSWCCSSSSRDVFPTVTRNLADARGSSYDCCRHSYKRMTLFIVPASRRLGYITFTGQYIYFHILFIVIIIYSIYIKRLAQMCLIFMQRSNFSGTTWPIRIKFCTLILWNQQNTRVITALLRSCLKAISWIRISKIWPLCKKVLLLLW